MLDIHLQRFIESMEIQGWSDRTIESYAAGVRFFFDYLENETDIRQLNEIDANAVHGYQRHIYNQEKNGKRLALATQHKRLVAVRSFFGFLSSQNLILFNPASGIDLPKLEKHLPRGVMTEAQVEQVLTQPDLATAIGFRDRTIMEVLYATGIRSSELRSLTVYDADLSGLRLMIRQGKNAKDRVTPLGEIAADYLKEYLLTARKALVTDDTGLLFVSKHGRPITRANLVWIIRKYVTQAGLSGEFTPHSFRHSCATHMLRHGADLRYIQTLLGHASVATTQVYTKVEDSDLKAMHRQYHPRERHFGNPETDIP